MRLIQALLAVCATASTAVAQTAAPWAYLPITVAEPEAPAPGAEVPGGPVPVPPQNPIPDGLPERPVMMPELPPVPPVAPGQQHWVSLNLGVFQPFAGRVGVKVIPRVNNSVWVEAFGGSALFEDMYGFGLRMQHTLLAFGRGDVLMVSPGLGVHIIPDWPTETRTRAYDAYYGVSYYDYRYDRHPLYFMYGDVDVSWLHDFGPRFGFELGVKFGLAGRVSGQVGRNYPSCVMWGKDLYPLFSVYSGFRI